jgi:methyl-accepting chemotaxis protein
MRLENLRIRTKLFLLIGVMIALTGVVATIGITRLTGMNTSLFVTGAMSDVQLLGARANQNLIVMNRAEYRMAADPSIDTIRAAAAMIDSNRKQFEDRLKQARAQAGPDEIALLDPISEKYQAYLAFAREVSNQASTLAGSITLSDSQKTLNEHVKTSRVAADDLQAKIKMYVDFLDQKGQSISDDAAASGKVAVRILVIVTGVGILLGIGLGYLLATFGISSPLNRSVSELTRLAAGDLDCDHWRGSSGRMW